MPELGTRWEDGQMQLPKCDWCGKDSLKLIKANHKLLGRIKICPACLEKEKENLISSGGCGCC